MSAHHFLTYMNALQIMLILLMIYSMWFFSTCIAHRLSSFLVGFTNSFVSPNVCFVFFLFVVLSAYSILSTRLDLFGPFLFSFCISWKCLRLWACIYIPLYISLLEQNGSTELFRCHVLYSCVICFNYIIYAKGNSYHVKS